MDQNMIFQMLQGVWQETWKGHNIHKDNNIQTG